ncbi:MAG: molybdopterin-dependent oxidoreductase [Bacteroidales bacterium]|nr:molybdopterin-dependent oxidoreductase [Bacteroidales bacterium]
MPTLPAESRFNFKEVELGYSDEQVALKEAQRCLECGCDALYECDLKKYSTEYGAKQDTYAGEYNEFTVDFRHPYIEIDSNKCILCSRCIRMCNEVVGANALGLINRGFNTYVAPTMGDALQHTSCESCGMCIEACPTGAITENVAFKPGPVKTNTLKTIDYYGSEGFYFGLRERNGFFYGAQAVNGEDNTAALISPQAKFGYTALNSMKRLMSPMKKTKTGWQEISYEEAFELIHQKVAAAEPDENALFAGARLTNEELYLLQKLARGAIKTNNINSFHYLGRGDGYSDITRFNVPFEELRKARKIIVVGTDLSEDHPVTGYLVNQAKKNGTEVVYVTSRKEGNMHKKADHVLPVQSCHSFAKAVNHYLLSNKMENGLFLKDHVNQVNEYRQQLLSEDFDTLYTEAQPCCMDHFVEFIKSMNNTENTVIVFSEKQVPANTAIELRNMALITGKAGKTASGLLALKEKNNAQGLTDMGISSEKGVGNTALKDEILQKMQQLWKIKDLPTRNIDIIEALQQKAVKNMLIFGEDPLGCAINKKQAAKMLEGASFKVVQDYFMTETAQAADLVLPAAWPVEMAGSYTNTQKRIQLFEQQVKPRIAQNNLEQLINLLGKFGINGVNSAGEALDEAFSLLAIHKPSTARVINTGSDNNNRMFNHGCDMVNKHIEEAFTEKVNR